MMIDDPVTPPLLPWPRRRLAALLAVSALLSMWAACVPAEPEAAPGSPGSAPLDARYAPQALETASAEPVVSYELPVNPSSGPASQHESMAVAAGNGLYLVVWMEHGNGPPIILGVRVRASDGQLLDASPLLIATGSTVQYRPAVAFDGTNFLVVWENIGNLPAIHGARVRASDGAVLDPTPLYLSRTPLGGQALAQHAPAVAFDGTHYLVTWHGYYSFGPQSFVTGVQAIRVRPSDGSCVESTSTFIAAGGINSRVAATDGYFLVSWTRGQLAEAARISAASGQRVDATAISLGTASGQPHATVTARSGEFLTAWIGSDGGLWARRVRASDGVKLGTEDTLVGPAARGEPEVSFDGVDYRFIWHGTRQGWTRTLTTRMSSQGTVTADAEFVLAEKGQNPNPMYRSCSIASAGAGRVLVTYAKDDETKRRFRGQMRLMVEGQSYVSSEFPVAAVGSNPQGHYGSAAAAGEGIYLVVWPENNPATSDGRPDILGVRVRASDGARLDATPLRIGTVASSADLEPAVAFDGTNFLVVWHQIDFSPVIFGARVRASDGAVLDSTPFLISRSPYADGDASLAQHQPALAFDGTNYLVTWTGAYYSGGYNGVVSEGVMAIRVRPDGTIADARSRLLSTRGSNSSRVAYVDGTYLVTWNKDQNVEAKRIDAATGQLLDTLPLSLAATAGNERSPAVAAWNGEFLVTWIGGDNALWARRVRASDGAKLGTADIAVAASASSYPAVTFDGRDYRIAWPDSGSVGRRVLSRRVSPEGVVAADAELLISEQHASARTERGAIAAVAPGRLLFSYPNYNVYVSKHRTMMRFVTEVRAPEPCNSGEPLLVLNGASPLTLECGAGPYRDPGARAFDGCGNPIQVHAYNTGTDASGPGPNMSYEGSYSVSYAAWDARGHTVSALRTVNVNDSTAPVLRLIGPAFVTHPCGSQWVDPGVQATDACYGNVSSQVWRTGQVNGWVPGTYTVSYSLTDSGGNSAVPITRTVEVTSCPW
jgi:hypothetical protein